MLPRKLKVVYCENHTNAGCLNFRVGDIRYVVTLGLERLRLVYPNPNPPPPQRIKRAISSKYVPNQFL
jgi:hypothetical protein